MKKLLDIGQKISEKQKLHANLVIQSVRDSMTSTKSEDANSEILMVDGYKNDYKDNNK